MLKLAEVEESVLKGMIARRPGLASMADRLLALHEALIDAYDAGGKLLVCGNGGSHADAVHIVGELCKSFERKRPITTDLMLQLEPLPYGKELAQYLEMGLPAIALGCSGALKTAVENDSPLRNIANAQETLALGKAGDVFIGISTSGNAENCLMAMSVARAVGMKTVSLTGPKGGKMAEFADIALRAPGSTTKEIQEEHLVLYHTFCAMIEAHYYPEMR